MVRTTGADMPVIAVKVGNSETAMGLFQGGDLVGSWKASTRAVGTADEAAQCVRTFLRERELPVPANAILCSIVPTVTGPWVTALREATGEKPLVVGPGLKNGLRLGYKDPAQLGADRVVNAVAAYAEFGAPVVVADFGTTTNLTVVGEDGVLLGGVIAPGLRTSFDALCESAAQLAEVSMQAPRNVIGRTTADAIRSGILFGEAARVDGLVDAVWAELGYDTALVATGRFAKAVCPVAKHDFARRPDLAFWGLYRIWQINRP